MIDVEIYMNLFIIICLIICAIQDLKTKTVSLWIMLASICILVIWQILINENYIMTFTGAIVGFIVIFISIATKGKIGIGDGIILVLTGIKVGFWRNMELFMYSLTIAAFISIILLSLKKVNKKSTIPFVPFVLIGYLILILT